MAGTTFWVTARRSPVPAGPAASTSYRSESIPAGAVRFQPTTLDSPAARFSDSAGRGSLCCGTRAETRTSSARSVALRTVNSERNRSPSRTTGAIPENIIRSCVARIEVEPVPKRSSPELATATIRKLGDRVVERDLDGRFSFGVKGYAGFPEQKGVEQFTGWLCPAPAPLGQRLEPEMPFADDVHLGCGRLHAIAPGPHHRFEQLPALVGHQFEQALVDCGHGHFGAARQGLRRPPS